MTTVIYREAGQFKTTLRRRPADLPDPAGPDRDSPRSSPPRSSLVPLIGNDYWFSAILIPFLILSLAALGLNILTGYAGPALARARRRSWRSAPSPPTTSCCASRAAAARRASSLAGLVAGGGRARLRPAEPAHQGLLPGRLDAGGAVLRRVGADQVRLVLQPQSLRRHQRADDGDPGLPLRHARSAATC